MSFYCKAFAFVVFIIFSFLSFSSEYSSVKEEINIPHTQGNIQLDGYLTEAVWTKAKTINLDIVNFPYNNTPSPIKTEAKIVENGEYLLIAFIANDPNPSEIQAYYGDRDTRWEDDRVGIKLDSQNNHRMNYEFSVNPLGIQMDTIQNNISNTNSDLWDGIWESFGRITETGYIVEIKIPFRIINFKASDKIKTWPFELFRNYPRNKWLTISHVNIDKDTDCKACQYPLAKGFKTANADQNTMLTPSVVIKSEHTRDIYDIKDDWQADNDIELGLDLRWGLDSNTLINATLNPDFSFIEADAAKLNVNENFSLNYDEKRPFFLENSQYFESNFDLIYTRNIIDPNYGVKLTGAQKQHTYGVFIANDNNTNFILPGNLSSDVASIKKESNTTAINYRYDANKDLSLGFISTLRTADQYHNVVAGIDTKYQITKSNSILTQFITSNTEYPDDLYQDFCTGEACIQQINFNCLTNSCPYNEQVIRSNKSDDFTDQAFKLEFHHRSEYWEVDLSHQEIGKNFRADLGFMQRADYVEDDITIINKYFSEEASLWQEASISGTWNIKHNEEGELIEKYLNTAISVYGPYLSNYRMSYTRSDEVGLRHDASVLKIDDNTTLFELDNLELSAGFKATDDIYLEFNYINGDKIDYIHDRKGKLNEIESYFSWFATKHLEIEVSHINSELKADGNNVYKADLIDSRVSYQFDAISRLKLSIIYCNIDRNLKNNPSGLFDKRKKSLSTQLIYSYKINPQTVFYLGYSDNSYQDDLLNRLQKEDKTFFTKISYAWIK